jgi:hypothetical protein
VRSLLWLPLGHCPTASRYRRQRLTAAACVCACCACCACACAYVCAYVNVCSTKDLGKYGDYFLGYDKATDKVNQSSDTFCAQMNIKPPYTPETENCIAYYWNLCNDAAVDYYINTVLGNMVSKGGKRRNMDGLFIDWYNAKPSPPPRPPSPFSLPPVFFHWLPSAHPGLPSTFQRKLVETRRRFPFSSGRAISRTRSAPARR